ncbi:FAD:protein FMN transferase [Gelidibacter salicanalis]|uniref:FAD:protein FMN transferase n=1 Tax=Gelidibacter salicanalis TaxID=291193 RepID=A0A934KWP4_9FLAO|nr:FAD:protein FMN transferase [Gelidibacter salicanalis]MBJ7880720.1 FAD:protein FMN transferase [Gelidibacter salicanalis]
MKGAIYFFCVVVLLFLVSCKTNNKETYKTLQGVVFGTEYNIQIDSHIDFSKQIDSVFKAVDRAANTYDKNSQISVLNRTGVYKDPSPTFVDMLKKAQYYYNQSNGYFNPAIYPLISEWKNGFENRAEIDTSKVVQLLKLTDFKNNISIEKNLIKTTETGVEIDLSALGEGYTIDAIASILNKSGVKNYMIELGGEMYAKGNNPRGKIWLIGIEKPSSTTSMSERAVINTVYLNDVGLSTSGSYRKFYSDSLGNKHSHIVDPKTGFPVSHHLLSASIKSKASTEADALATACMAMGLNKAKQFIEDKLAIEGFLIFSENDSLKVWSSNKFLQE